MARCGVLRRPVDPAGSSGEARGAGGPAWGGLAAAGPLSRRPGHAGHLQDAHHQGKVAADGAGLAGHSVTADRRPRPDLTACPALQDCSWETVIQKDINRTFTGHEYFREAGGVGQDALFKMSKAYAVYDAEVGYCQGLSFLEAALLLHVSGAAAAPCWGDADVMGYVCVGVSEVVQGSVIKICLNTIRGPALRDEQSEEIPLLDPKDGSYPPHRST